MHPSFYMQYTVDKQKEQEVRGGELKIRSLLRRFARTDDDFPALLSNYIGKHVRNVCFIAKLFI